MRTANSRVIRSHHCSVAFDLPRPGRAGVLSGSPTASDTFNFVIRATDSNETALGGVSIGSSSIESMSDKLMVFEK